LSLPQHRKDGSNQPQMPQLRSETTNQMMKCTAISVYIRVDNAVKKSKAESDFNKDIKSASDMANIKAN